MRIGRSQGRFHKIRFEEFFDFQSVKRVGLYWKFQLALEFIRFFFRFQLLALLKGPFLKCRCVCETEVSKALFLIFQIGSGKRWGLPTRQLT